MKGVNKNWSKSLGSQRVPGREGGEDNTPTDMSGGKPSMILPGEGGVEKPPGVVSERSAAHAAEPMKRFGG